MRDRNRLAFRIFAAVSILLVATVAGIGMQVGAALEENVVAEIESSLDRNATLVARLARARLRTTGDLPNAVREWAPTSDFRVTILDESGRALADSQFDPADIPSQIASAEVAEALQSGRGSARRATAPSREIHFHATSRIEADGRVLVARVSVPIRVLEERVVRPKRAVWATCAVALPIALLLAWLLTRRLVRPLLEMTEVADAMAHGEYDRRIRVRRRDEVGVLASALNRLGAELGSRIETMTEERARLQAILSGMSEGVVAVDEATRILFLNRAAGTLLGVREAGTSGRSLWDVCRNPDLVDLVTRGRDEAAGNEMRLLGESGEVILDAVATPIHAGTTRGVVVVLQDVTAIRRLETMRRDFVANVSHELQTPLTSIIGYVETLVDSPREDPATVERFLRKIDSNARRLRNLVRDLLDLARVESRRDERELEVVDVAAAALDCVARHRELADERHVRLEWAEPPGPAEAVASREGLRQILDNLVENAIKYTPEGGEVRVHVRPTDREVAVDVSDTGIGIPPAEQERVFERFYRVDKARSTASGGTGLGLSIVKHLVQAMGGSVGLESRPGAGSRFTVRLPAPDPRGK